MTSRRTFLGGLAGLIAGAVLDPERLLWVPGKKLISIAKPQPWKFMRSPDGQAIFHVYNQEGVGTGQVAVYPFIHGRTKETRLSRGREITEFVVAHPSLYADFKAAHLIQ